MRARGAGTSPPASSRRRRHAAPPTGEPADVIRARCPDAWTGERLYARLADQGIELGPSFRGISRLWRRDGEALARDRAARGRR